ncbi:MAG: beta-ketoacyl synthase N-terminal-like domain-containing protein, partial [Phycisphaerae bacterium]
LNPPAFASASIAQAARRAGASGGAALEFTPADKARPVVAALIADGGPFTLSVPDAPADTLNLLRTAEANGLERVVLCHSTSRSLARDIRALRSLNVELLVEVTSLDDALIAERKGAGGLILKGSEAGGLIGEETTFILLQRVMPRVSIAVWARGGIGPCTAAACRAAGAAGVVLDWQLALTVESRLPDAVKLRIARMDGSETAVLGQELPDRFRAYSQPGEKAFAALQAIEQSILQTDQPTAKATGQWRESVEARVGADADGERLLLFGQDAALAAPLAERHRTVGGICRDILRESARRCRAAARDRALRPDGPLAASHGTRYPIVQGPMTRVSDRAEFALSVAEGGGLPFLALALMRGAQVGELLEETKHKLADRPWGVGILGFVPRELREEQLAEVRKHPPPFAIIAGGRPDQAAELERDGIRTYLHVPSPGLLSLFVESGSRRFIFEGRECGGHVGPRSSFVLWETMIRVLLEEICKTGAKAEQFHVLFAGGVHDALSSAMTAAMAASLTELGVRVGVLMGTAYLFTREAVSSGAIVKKFQTEAIACDETILLETGVGLATRAARTPFAKSFADEKRRLIKDGRDRDSIRDHLEALNLGRLWMASKGIARRDKPATAGESQFVDLNAKTQRADGMYMIGQVAALRDEVCTIEALHEDVSRGGVQALAAWAPPPVNAERSKPSDVAIIGMACTMPGANDLQRFWENILNKVDAIKEVPSQRWDWQLYFDADRAARDKVYSRWGGFIDAIAFDPTKYGMPPNVVPSVEPLQLLMLDVVRKAINDAGYADRPFARERTSVILGAGGGVADLGNAYGFRSLLPYFMAKAGRSPEDA